ncbi:MAG TPA: GNAT family N-acetyltransferase [Paracoccaceae bacterium]|nr:GNAT family N-acetyltransferase [Sphingomonadaceae bacterium]HQY45279.1 GNAT family N-acetyltransferase [Paracoccaceae bacterium]
MTQTLLIRAATAQDEAGWRKLWQGFLDYYQVVLPDDVTSFTWHRLMDPASPLAARLAVLDGRTVGFAIHQHHPSTWVMGDDCYLEDLFVDPACRGSGIGRALIEDLIGHARAQGWKRLYWNTNADNAAARRLYDQFTPDDGHVRYRLVL